jgi:N-acetylmuramoyl-L-alanine amidase
LEIENQQNAIRFPKSVSILGGVMNRLFIVLMLSCVTLWGNFTVDYGGNKASEEMYVQTIDGQEYLRINELTKAFQAKMNADMIQQRLYLNLYDQQLIFLLESSYLEFNGEVYNMKLPLLNREGKYYVPISFVQHLLPLFFPDKIEFKGRKIKAKNVNDTSLRVIVLDPGHGGKDPGAVGFSKKIYEKDIVLSIAKKLKILLEKHLDVVVLLTREDDLFVSLQDRTKFANQNHANLFISLHCNAHRRATAGGMEVYYLSTAKTDDARAVEALENAVVYEYEGGTEAVQKYDDLSFILADMAQNEHLKESNELAIRLQQDLITATNLQDRGVKQANFYVLRGAFMPAVLVELGFLSNREEEKLLSSNAFQEKLANALFEGIKNFKIKYDKMQ